MENKKARVYYWMLLVVGSFILGVANAYYEWPKSIEYMIFVGWMIFLMGLMFYINMRWYKQLSQELMKMGNLLVEDGNVSHFLEENDRLLRDKKSRQLQSIYKINHAIACCYEDEFEGAEEWLVQVNPKFLAPTGRSAYFADFAWVKMNLGKMEEGIEILKKNEKLLSDMSKLDETLDTLIKMMKVKEHIFNKEIDKAKEVFVQVKKREIPYNAKDIQKLEQELEQAMGETV